GSGTITLSNRSSNRIRAANAAGDRLTLGVNQVLQGAGQIGAGSALDLVNRGTINANQSTALTISVNAANSVRNEAGGLMQASSSLSTLNLVNVVQNDGTIAANSGNVNASAGFNGSGTARTTGTGVLTVGADSTVGILINDGSAANALTLGTKNITVSVDYTNANAGSGNAFNRRANVSGTGQILAGGDVSQVITGANVSNGNTANATLTIGNVRVGATTFDYQIGNAGSTGPTLRGAIQTSVNGGNLTDARLSGAGVTAGNYNADGPGGSSTNLGVTFTAASAGVLAPLSGQVLNLRSNFDNIADQKLNIVLASGAAAYNAATGSASPSPTVNLGSARVGGTLAQTFTVTNTAPAGAYTEDLNASFIAASGAVSHNGGVISALVAGGSNSSAMSASLDTASAGAKTGSVTIDYQTAGTVGNVSNGLAAASAGTQTITLNGAVYNMAVGSATPGPVSIANQRVGGSNTVALTVGNTAAAGNYSEDLRASFGSSTGAATNNGGVINALLAGGSDGSAMRVGVDTGTAGAKSGTVTLNYQTTGTVNGVSNGLGLTGVGNQVINVSGNVYQAASGQLVGNSWNFGTLQVGQQVSQNLVVKNTASTGAYSEDLNVSFGAAGNSQISGSGSLSGIQAGQTSTGANGTMTVTVTGLTAGALSSGIAVNYESAGKVGGVDNGLGTLAVGSENFAVNGTINAVANVINQASPAWGSTSVNLGAVRVGAASPTASLALTNQATAAPQAALNASIASNGAPVTASGSVSLLAPGASSNALTVGLNTAVAGNYTGGNAGSATVQLVSDASNVGGCAPNCQMTLAPQVISVSGKVYNPAVGQLDTPVLDFGIVRVGDTVSAKNIIVKNMATASALDDTLHASVSGLSGPFTDGGPAAGITAGSSGQITVNLGTAAAGVYSQSGNVQFLSQNADMADVSAGADASVLIQAQINNLANADFDLLSGLGALTDDGNGNYLLDLGNIALGSSGNWMLQLDNDVSGPADWLLGAFDLTGVSDFTSSGWNNLGAGGLAAGQAQGGLSLGFVASALGAVQDQIVFNGWSHNGYGADLAQTRTLTVRANVYDPGNNVPEPGTLALVALGALLARRRCSRGGAGGHA
ncbi:MAG: choice-of-anchor D domain-containing protein, partial [Burkholderiales bacterium]|nr:choice-of-anchor D domain-containing protein [Burkholderiales bacterium]